MMLIGQILGCLFVAAAIGAAVGWLLRNLSADSLKQRYLDLGSALHGKEQALETALYDLKVKASAIQILESKIQSAEALARSTQQELSVRNDRLSAVHAEWSADKQRLLALEAADEAVRQRASQFDSVATDHAESLRQSDHARREAAQALDRKEQECLLLQQRLAELKHTQADRDRLHQRVEELEPFQGRVHWLEVQLSDRDAEHRAMYHQLEAQVVERTRQLAEVEPLRHRLEEREDALRRWEAQHNKHLSQQDALAARIAQQQARIDELRERIAQDAHLLQDKDRQLNGLQDRILALESQQAEMAGQVNVVGEKEEEISRLRKRLVEVRAALRIKTDGGAVAPRSIRQNGNQLSLQMGQMKPAKAGHKDDLKKIHGIGPVFARTLNKIGLHTFIQIARWKPDDIAKVAKKLDTAPNRIKRDNWIADAKKQHYRKYGERL